MQCDCNLGNSIFLLSFPLIVTTNYIILRNNSTVWLGDWLRRWLRESYESHSALIPEVHAMYDLISATTCLDSRFADTRIPLVQLYPDHICHASALSPANSLPPKHFNVHTFLIIVLALLLS